MTVTAETALILLFKPLQLGDVRSGAMVTTTVHLKQVFILAHTVICHKSQDSELANVLPFEIFY